MENLMLLKTKDDYLCIDTSLFNALNHAGLSYVWDYKNKSLKFENKSDYDKAMMLKEEIEKQCDINQEVITKKPNIISNVSKVKEEKIQNKRGRLF